MGIEGQILDFREVKREFLIRAIPLFLRNFNKSADEIHSYSGNRDISNIDIVKMALKTIDNSEMVFLPVEKVGIYSGCTEYNDVKDLLSHYDKKYKSRPSEMESTNIRYVLEAALYILNPKEVKQNEKKYKESEKKKNSGYNE